MLGLNQVSMLFILILIGYFFKKRGMISDSMVHDVAAIVFNVGLPAFILTSMSFDFSKEVLFNSITLLVISIVVYMLMIFMGKIFNKLLGNVEKAQDVYQYMFVFANVGYMGYPVVYAVYGQMGVFYTAIFNLGFNLFSWTYGVYLLDRDSREKNKDNKAPFYKSLAVLLNPAIVALMLGMVLFLTSTKLPPMIFDTAKMIGGIVTPLSMMCVGFILAGVEVKDILSDYKVLIASFIRLIVIPLVIFIILFALGEDKYLLIIPVVLTSMPAAANTAIFAIRYNSDYKLASKLVFVSTLMSIITIPIVINFLNLITSVN